jgi:acetyl esterase/lipase
MQTRFNVEYAQVGGESLTFDWFAPATPGRHPAVICLHGGGWISGDKSMMQEVAAGLVQHGFVAICPSYRLAPLHPFPAAVEDVQSAVRYVRRNAVELAVVPTALASLGNSAGGHLAAMLGLTSAIEDGIDSRVSSVVNICGISDLTNPHGNHLPVAMGFLEQFMGGPYEGREALWAQASPVHYVDSGAASFLIIHGEADDVVPVGQSEALAGKLFAAGTKVRLQKISGEGHSFTYGAWLRIEVLYLGFLAETLKGELVA